MKTAILIALLPLLCAWPGCSVLHVKSDPIQADCAAECYVPCEKPPKWGNGDLNRAVVLLELDGIGLDRCDARRGSCATCLRVLQEKGVILGVPTK